MVVDSVLGIKGPPNCPRTHDVRVWRGSWGLSVLVDSVAGVKGPRMT